MKATRRSLPESADLAGVRRLGKLCVLPGNGLMRPSKALRSFSFILAAITLVIGFVVWPGCITPPLPTKRTPVHARDKDDFKIRKREHPTREEVFERLGQPDVYLNDIRVAGYQLNDAIRRKIWLLFFVIPVNIEPSPGSEVFYVEFDEQERVRRSGIQWLYRSEKMSTAGRQWLRQIQLKETAERKH